MTADRLVINLATRGRPKLCLDTVQKTVSNIRNEGTLLVISVDNDENNAWTSEFDRTPLPIAVLSGPREDSLGTKYNRMLCFPANVYMSMVDYAPHTTLSFDQIILDAAKSFPDGIGVIYNRMANLAFPEINAATRRMVELMDSKFYPEYWPVWFVDHWLEDIAKMIGRIAYANVEIDTSKRPGTQNLTDLPFWTQLFNRLAAERESIARDIIRAMDSPRWEKELLERNFPLTRQRSVIINGIALQQNRGGHSPSVDNEIHERLKAKAQAKLAQLGQPPIPPSEPLIRHPYGVIISVPCLHLTYAAGHVSSMDQTMLRMAEEGIPFNKATVNGDPFVDHARCKLSTWFLNLYQDAENIFFVDDDVGDWKDEDFVRILKRPEPIVCGVYEKKQKEKDFPCGLALDDNNELIWSEDKKLIKAVFVPTGFMRIKRWVIEKLAERYGTFDEFDENGDIVKYYAIFQHGIGPDQMWWGEDGAFVRRCEGIGVDVWIDPFVQLSHRGMFAWTTKLSDHLDQFRKTAKLNSVS